VIIAAALAGVIVLMAAALIWAARLLHIGNLDMQALADKVGTPEQSLPLLSQWCSRQASVSPVRQQGAELELRRRQSLERVHAVLVAEQVMAAPYG
jgi:hypothetical protein